MMTEEQKLTPKMVATTILVKYTTTLSCTIATEDAETMDELIEGHIQDYCHEHKIDRNNVCILSMDIGNNYDLPDVLTVESLHTLQENGWIDDFETFEDRNMAIEFQRLFRSGLNSFKSWLYTQVDSEISDDVVYRRGDVYVNRTGVYAVLWSR